MLLEKNYINFISWRIKTLCKATKGVPLFKKMLEN